MAKTVRNIILIAGSIFFIFQLLSIGLIIGIPVIIAIDLLVLLLTGKKEETIPAIKAAGKWGRDRLEILGTAGEQLAETAGVLGVKTARAIGRGIEAGYKEMGGTEGAKKAVGKLTKAAGEGLKVVGYGAVKTVEAAVDAVADISKQVAKDREIKERRNLLKDAAELVDFDILTDD